MTLLIKIRLSIIFSIVYYLLRTRFIGTPFNDSLTNEQKQLLYKSKIIRSIIFTEGVVFGFILIFMISKNIN